MQKPKYFLRYNFIIQKLRTSKEATLKELMEYLAMQSELTGYDLNISPRTFERDKNEILSLFSILIEFDHSRKVYYISDDDNSENNNRMLEAFNMFNSLNLTDNNKPYILFEKRKPQGIEHFYGLLHAIKNHLVLKFIYKKFWDDEVSERTVEPYALKESNYRWYLLALDKKDENIKSFGLDRILDMELTKQKFKYPDDYDPSEQYFHSFGIITQPGEHPKDVILSFEPFQGKFIKSFPLHHSQKVITDNEKEVRIRLNILITNDFIMEILSYGGQVKVISPKSLQKELCGVLENALKNYK